MLLNKELDVISDYEQSFQAVGTLPFLTINKRILFHVIVCVITDDEYLLNYL